MQVCAQCGLYHPVGQACPVLTSLPARTADEPLAVGTLVANRYLIKAIAHRSTMSTVYQATDTQAPDTVVALKECNARGLQGDERAEALRWHAREAGLLSSLKDRRLPPFRAAFSEGDRHFIAMDYIEGETLEERVARAGPLPEDHVAVCAVELAELLHYLHSQEPPVIFRDLKPANVLIDRRGKLTLLDFGVARTLCREVPGTAVGTPGYAPPEQYQGLADEHSDLYALGATMHRLLTGYNPEEQAPFRHPSVRTLRPDVSPGMALLVEMLLQVAPQRRLQSAKTIVGFLDHRHGRRLAAPLFSMYVRMMVAAVIAVVASFFIYMNLYGPPLYDPYPGDFKTYEPLADTLRVLAVFAPGLLVLLPLLSPTLREMARGYLFARRHRTMALRIWMLGWLMPLLAWLLRLHLHRWGDQALVPGRQMPATLWALGGVCLATWTLAGGIGLLRKMCMPGIRKARHTVVVALLWVGPSAAAVFMAPVPAHPVIATAAQVEFGTVSAIAISRQGNLEVLDTYGVHERMDDGRFRLLLNLQEPCTPYFRNGTFYRMGGMGLAPDGRLVLADAALLQSEGMGLQADGSFGQITAKMEWLYTVPAPGELNGLMPMSSALVRAPELAAGPANTLYVTDPSRSAMYQLDLTTEDVPDDPFHPSNLRDGWQPRAVAADEGGAVYIINAASDVHAVQLVQADGTVRTVTLLPPIFTESARLTLARDGAGNLYAANGAELFIISPGGHIAARQIGRPISMAIGIGTRIYFALSTEPGLYVTGDAFRTVDRVGRLFTLHCSVQS